MEEEASELAADTGEVVEVVVDKLSGWLSTLIEMLPNIAVALMVVAIFALLARLVAKLVERAAQKTSQNAQVTSLLRVTARLSVVIVGVFIALGVLHLEKTVTSMIAGVGVVGLALGFAFQDIAANFMSGVIMAIREPMRIGDLVETQDELGHVERVTLRATVLRNFAGQLVVIPNKEVLQNKIINYSQTGERRIEVEVGVAYDTDLAEARRVAVDAIEKLPGHDPSKPADAIWTGFGASSVDLSVRFWIDLDDDNSDYLVERSRGIEAIKAAFDEAGIEIPFPIRTLALEGSSAELLATLREGPRPGETVDP